MDQYGNPMQPNPQGYYGMPPASQTQDPPLSPWAFIGLQFLFGLPGIGFIICIIIAIAASNRNVKNFAIAQIIIVAAAVILTIVLMLIGGLSFATLTEYLQSAYESSAAGT